jgi:hypothetical protein
MRLAGEFVDDAERVIEEATTIFDDMIPGMAYVDSPDKPMAYSLFGCSATLAVYLALHKRGVDVHAFGSTMLQRMMNAPAPEREPEEQSEEDRATPRERFAGFIEAGEASRRDTVSGEFVFEAFLGEGRGEWGMNIKSCAICHAFSKYDAMDLVPYMCATDDVMSDKGDQGLRRTGSIALGASHCDFRYKAGGEPRPLAGQYPELIRWERDDPQDT